MSFILVRILLVTLFCKNGFGDSRINLGRKIDITDAPYMARVRIKQSPTVGSACDGTIISDMYILTAGHCLTGKDNRGNPDPPLRGPSNFSVLIGATDLDYEEQGEVFTVSKVFFREFSNENDIAMLKLSSRITFDGKTKMPVTLENNPNYTAKNRTDVYVDGWGVNPENTYNLLRVDVYTVTVEECNENEPGRNRSHQICTKGDNGAGPCGGDSGGPMLRSSDGVQIGIVSYGPNTSCFDPTRGSSIYTSVPRNLQWIRCIMSGNGSNKCGGTFASEPEKVPMNNIPTTTTTRKPANFFGFPFNGLFSNSYIQS